MAQKHAEICAQIIAFQSSTPPLQLTIKEALHVGWENSSSVNKQVNHVNLTLSF